MSETLGRVFSVQELSLKYPLEKTFKKILKEFERVLNEKRMRRIKRNIEEKKIELDKKKKFQP